MSRFSRKASHGATGATILLAICALAVTVANAAPSIVEPFDVGTWQRLQQELPRPSVIVFTATYCASCPAVMGKLSDALEERGIAGDVVAVVIDEADEPLLLKSEHYQRASRLFLFDGNEASLRYHVDPRWRGVTPYLALLPVKGEPAFVAGTPDDAQIAAWLRK